MLIKNREDEHDDVCGRSFALYDPDHLEEFTGLFEQPLGATDLDSRGLFEGKLCLDAGAGNGRGALLMLKSAAASVTAVDISHENLRSVDRNLKSFGFSNHIDAGSPFQRPRFHGFRRGEGAVRQDVDCVLTPLTT